jgi:nitroimidazol reductase NimA-like FMN-containing flavoprotein (pyridoxamine 5'-phosphate oxidase superfamily)
MVMYHSDREIRSKKIITAILDMCDVINIGFFDDEYPYMLPVNFGYEFGEKLVFYTHHAVEGYKIRLVEKNPKVCVVTHRFIDTHQSGHDYRSVMAFGEMSFIKNGDAEYAKAWKILCENNGRKVPDEVFRSDFKVLMGKIECHAENVTGKAQYPISTVEDAAFPASEGETPVKSIPRREK